MKTLFDTSPIPDGPRSRTPLAAKADPATSHAAAADPGVQRQADDQARQFAAGVMAHPGHTANELARIIGMDRHVAGKRASVAERMGLVKRGSRQADRHTGRAAETWWPIKT